METILIYQSLVNEIFFYWNRIRWTNQWKNIIKLLIDESLILSTGIYFLLFTFLGIFGLVIGLFIGFYKEAYEIFIFLLLILLRILTPNELNNNASDLSRIFPFKILEPVNSTSTRVFLKESFEQVEIPFPTLGDSINPIDVEFSFYEVKHFQFQLFYFYKGICQKIKS